MTTLNLQVAASGDDVGRFGGSFSTIGATMGAARFGSLTDTMALFSGVSGLSGATIDTAIYMLYGQVSDSAALTKVQASDEESPSAPTNVTEYDAVTKTTAAIDWDGSITLDAWNNSPEYKSVIQELADSYDPTAVLLTHFDDGGSGFARLLGHSYDDDSATAAKLDITYTAGGGPAATLLTRTLLGAGI